MFSCCANNISFHVSYFHCSRYPFHIHLHNITHQKSTFYKHQICPTTTNENYEYTNNDTECTTHWWNAALVHVFHPSVLNRWINMKHLVWRIVPVDTLR